MSARAYTFKFLNVTHPNASFNPNISYTMPAAPTVTAVSIYVRTRSKSYAVGRVGDSNGLSSLLLPEARIDANEEAGGVLGSHQEKVIHQCEERGPPPVYE